MKKKIFIVEDHILMRRGIRSTLSTVEDEFDIIGEAESGEEFFVAIRSGLIPDLLLLDIVLPGMSGVEIAKRMQDEYPFVKVLILSSQSDLETIDQLLEVGIAGFVSKSASSNKLLSAVRDVVEGLNYYGQEISKIIYNIHISKKRYGRAALTIREKEILRLCGEGFNVKQVAESLNISTRTVESHKLKIFSKLGLKNAVDLVRYAIRNGIIDL